MTTTRTSRTDDDESPHTLDVLRAIRMTAEIVMLVERLVGVR